MDAAISARDRVRVGLMTHGPVTAKDLADKAGVAYSTTTALLRRFAAAGLATKIVNGDGPDRWQYTTSDTTTSQDDAAASQAVVPAADDQPTQQPDPADVQPTQQPDPGDDSSPNSNDPAVTADGDDQVPDAPAPPADDAPSSAPAPAPAPEGCRSTGQLPRLSRGQLRLQVLGVLQDNPDEKFSPHDVAKRLDGRSDGAVANALDKLVEHGNAQLVCEKPRRFQAV